jgi:hypothetical protein
MGTLICTLLAKYCKGAETTTREYELTELDLMETKQTTHRTAHTLITSSWLPKSGNKAVKIINSALRA